MWLRRGPNSFGNSVVHLIGVDTFNPLDREPWCGKIAPLRNIEGWSPEFEGGRDAITCDDCRDELLAALDDDGDDS